MRCLPFTHVYDVVRTQQVRIDMTSCTRVLKRCARCGKLKVTVLQGYWDKEDVR